MDNHEISPVGQRVELRMTGIVFDAGEMRKSAGKCIERVLPCVIQQVHFAPRAGRFAKTNIVSAALQFAADSAQEMRIPVVPAGCDCMHETDDFHATASILS